MEIYKCIKMPLQAGSSPLRHEKKIRIANYYDDKALNKICHELAQVSSMLKLLLCNLL